MSAWIDKEALIADLEAGTGAGVRVAILDTGVDESHPDLAGKLAASYDLVRAGGKFACKPAKGTDEVGHGTACAWIVKQMAPEAEVHSVKIIGGHAGGSNAELIEGMRWAIEQRMDVVNISAGTLDRKARETISDLADQAFYNGVTIVAAANNNPRLKAYPAMLSSVIAVEAQAIEDKLTVRYRLERATEVEADGIYVEVPGADGRPKYFTGTSFACPRVSAIAARLLSVRPNLQPFEVRALLYHLTPAG